MYKFDANGDINLGYDLFLWEGDQSDVHGDDIIAEYDPTKGGFLYIRNDLSEFEVIYTLCFTHIFSTNKIKRLFLLYFQCQLKCHNAQHCLVV